MNQREESTMSYMDWKDKTKEFKKMDVRGIQGNFFPGLKKQASGMNVGDGFEVIQSFDPIPLYRKYGIQQNCI